MWNEATKKSNRLDCKNIHRVYKAKNSTHIHTGSQPRGAHSVKNKNKNKPQMEQKIAFFFLRFDFGVFPFELWFLYRLFFLIVRASRFSFSSSRKLYALVACSFFICAHRRRRCCCCYFSCRVLCCVCSIDFIEMIFSCRLISNYPMRQ